MALSNQMRLSAKVDNLKNEKTHILTITKSNKMQKLITSFKALSMSKKLMVGAAVAAVVFLVIKKIRNR